MSEFTELEKAVFTKLLDGDHPVLTELREQLSLSGVKSRKYTGVGFFTHMQNDKCTPLKYMRFRLGDVVARIKGIKNGAGFVLFVDKGLITMLEGYTYDEPWPNDVSNFKLAYTLGDERDWAFLEKTFEK